jgi:hypothetical protein
LLESIQTLSEEVIKKYGEGVDVSLISTPQYLSKLFDFVLKCYANFMTHKLAKKAEPEEIK